jgi:Tfp pilus assembly protein PilV
MRLKMKDVNTMQTRDLAASNKKYGEQGFTLIETAIALVVMMVVGLGAASLFFFAVKANSRGRDRELSMAVAQQQMEILRNSKFDNLDATVTTFGGANRTVITGGRQYNLVTTITDTVAGDDTQKTVKVQVTPRGATGAAAVTQVFGGVVLVTLRSTSSLGPYRGP